uniref:Uncharacterized protein n=1 Tax=Setaria viridis TaxID=4556 RepID=A0A4U6U4X7_SETVI|nr:hypothetical protein SEVIR_6G025966v2 [Setaria viridis]
MAMLPERSSSAHGWCFRAGGITSIGCNMDSANLLTAKCFLIFTAFSLHMVLQVNDITKAGR